MSIDVDTNDHGSTISRKLSTALRECRAGNTSAAVDAVNDVLRLDITNSQALELGIQLATRSGDLKNVLRYRAILFASVSRSTSRTDLAQAHFELGNWDAAIDIADPFLSKSIRSRIPFEIKVRSVLSKGGSALLTLFLDEIAEKANVEVVEWVAAQLRALDQTEAAIDWLERAWPAGLLSASAQFLRSRMLYECKRYDQALTALQGLPETELSNKEYVDANLFIARIATGRKARELGLEAYSRVFAKAPSNEEAVDALVRAALGSSNVQEAEKILHQFESHAPGASIAVALRAAIEVHEGHLDDALDRFKTAIDTFGIDVELHCRFADLLADLRDLDQMISVLDKAALNAPNSPRVFSRRVRGAHLQGRYDYLLKISEEYLQLVPGDELAMLQKSNALLHLGRRTEALDQYLCGARCHKRNANFWRAAGSLATSLNRKDMTQSISTAVKDIFSSKTVQDLTALADILDAASYPAEALDSAKSALALQVDAIEANQLAARLLVADGRYAEAWPYLKVLGSHADRGLQTTRLYAQVASGFRYLRPSQADLVEVEPITSRFPDVLFDEIVSRSRVATAEDCNDLIIHVSSSLASGGAERQVALTIDALAKRIGKEHVELVADDLDPVHARDFFLPVVNRSGVRVTTLREDLRSIGAWRDLLAVDGEQREAVRVIGAMPRDLAQIALPLFTLFRLRRPKVVHLWQDMIAVAGGIAATLAGVPKIVLGIRSTRPVEMMRARYYFHAAYQALLSRKGVSIIANSNNGARDYEDWLRSPKDTVETVHNGYDFQSMRERATSSAVAAVRAELGFPHNAIVLGGVMRCSFEKRPELWTDVAISIAGKEPQFHGVLIGDGPMREELIERVRLAGMQNRIKFVGRRAPIEPWMKAMDLLFLSSITEGLPNVLIEAQSLGVPVATMRVGGAPETVQEDVTAAVIDEGPIDSVCYALNSVLFDAEKRRTYGEAAVRWVDSMFSVDALVEKLLDIYRR